MQTNGTHALHPSANKSSELKESERRKRNFKRRRCASKRAKSRRLKRRSSSQTSDGGFKKSLAFEHFVDQQYLASGTFGKIYKATALSSRQKMQVAIKKVVVAESGYSSALKEAEILKSLHHPNIVSIFGIISNRCEAEMWIVMEFLNAGSLRAYCTGDKHLNFAEKLKVSYDCWSALSYLHSGAKVTHKDIKPENILLHRPCEKEILAKLCDFGLAKMVTSMTQTQLASITGTAMYFPPEYVDALRNPEKADVYSTGASLCELYSRSYFWCQAGCCVQNFSLTPCWREDLTLTANLSGIDRSLEAPVASIHGTWWSRRVRNLLAMAVSFDRRFRPSAEVMKGHFLTLLRREKA